MSGAVTIQAVRALRLLLWHNGFRPVPVQNAVVGDKASGKAPLGKGWQLGAAKDPPECLNWDPVPHALNTGILCAGLRAIDVDVDDPLLAVSAKVLAFTRLGATIVRTRVNSPRCLLVYRAEEGAPVKQVRTGKAHSPTNACKVECLGLGQQFVAFGQHYSGVELQWLTGSLTDHTLADIPAISEPRLIAYLNEIAGVINAEPAEPVVRLVPRSNGHDAGPATAELRDVAAALAFVPNAGPADWEAWNSVGMAIYAATAGAEGGWTLWRDWSAKNPADDPDATLGRWEHYADSPPDRTGAGKLFAMAVAASPGWRPPSRIGVRRSDRQVPEARERPEVEYIPPPQVPPPGGDDWEGPPEGPPVPPEGEEPPPPEAPPGGPRPDEPPELPVIICEQGELPRMLRAAQTALLDSGAAIYQRGMLVQPIEHEYPAADGGVTHSAKLEPLTLPALLKLMAESAIWQKWRTSRRGVPELVICDPPERLVQLVLSNRGNWPFPTVRGVLTCPTLRPDGSLLAIPGYDPISRYYLMFPTNLVMPEMPMRPGIGEALGAWTRLDRLLDSYPFVNKASRSVALAMLMTQVLRCAMPVSPLMAVSAKAPGTGKSHLVDLASTIAIGRPCPAMGTGKKDEETEKGINAMLIAGVPGFSIDNVSRDLDTPTLNMATERPMISIRLFGVLEIVEIENAVTIYMTGNNLAIIDEQGRRTIRCELDAGVERPERRDFAEDPIHIARENRGRYIADVLTITRAYHLSDEHVAPWSLGSYGAWSRFVREPLIWLGQADPADTIEQAASEDPSTLRLRTVLAGWWESFGFDPKTLADAARDARPEFRDTLKQEFPARGGGEVDVTRFGYWLRKFGGRIADGRRFAKEQGNTHGVMRWRIENVR